MPEWSYRDHVLSPEAQDDWHRKDRVTLAAKDRGPYLGGELGPGERVLNGRIRYSSAWHEERPLEAVVGRTAEP